MPHEFHGDRKHGQPLLQRPEEWLKHRLLPCVPRRVETYHLTLMTLLWAALVPAFCFLARTHIAWIWGASLMIALQYVTDLLDGAIGRQRQTGLIRWGYYMDHFLDYLFLCSLLIGYAILLPHAYRAALFFLLAMFGGFMVNSFLHFACTNEFRITYLGVGPTEVRLLFVVVNAIVFAAGWTWLAKVVPYAVVFSTFGLFVTVYNTQRELWRRDMRAKREAARTP